MVLDKIFRFLDVFSVLVRSLTSVGGGDKVENCLHDPSTLSQSVFCFLDFSRFFGFGQNAAKLGVCKNPTLTGSLSEMETQPLN